MPDELNTNEPEVGSEEWIAQEHAALEADMDAEDELEVSTQGDGGGESDAASEVGQVGGLEHAAKPKAEAQAKAPEAESSEQDQTTDDGGDAGKTPTPALGEDYRVPVAALSSARREARKANKQVAQLQAENEALKAKTTAYEFESAAEGVELKGQTELQPMTTEAYQDLVDKYGTDEANNQRLQRDLLIKQQSGSVDDEANSAQPYSNDEVDDAIADNPTVYGWMMMARDGQESSNEGMQKPWNEFVRLDGELPVVPNESANERFKRVAEATKAQIIKDAGGKPPEQSTAKEAPKNLSDVPGTGRMAKRTEALGAMTDLAGIEAAMADEELSDAVFEDAGWF